VVNYIIYVSNPDVSTAGDGGNGD